MSTSGGQKGATELARVALTAAQLATLGTVPVAIPVANPAGHMLVATDYIEQFQYVNSTFDFSAGHLVLLDTGNGILINPTVQTFASDVMSAQPITVGVRATADVAGAGFKLGTVGNANPTHAGPVATISLGVGGLGYAPNDTGVIHTGNNDATYRVTTIGALGVVTGVVLVAAGSNYTTAGNPHATSPGGAQPGVGAGLTINTLTFTVGTSSLLVAVAYVPVTPI